MRSAAYSVRSTAAKPGRKFYTRTKIPALRISHSIPRTRKFFLPFCGPRAAPRGPPDLLSKDTPAAFSNQWMAGTPGRHLLKDCPRTSRASPVSASASRPAIRVACTRSWTRRNSAVFFARTTRARAGSASTTKIASGAAVSISPGCAWLRTIKTPSIFAILPPIARPTPARTSPPSKALPAATITTPSGSIPKIRKSFSLRPIKARPSA